MKKIIQVYNKKGIPLFATLRKNGLLHLAGISNNLIEGFFDESLTTTATPEINKDFKKSCFSCEEMHKGCDDTILGYQKYKACNDWKEKTTFSKS